VRLEALETSWLPSPIAMPSSLNEPSPCIANVGASTTQDTVSSLMEDSYYATLHSYAVKDSAKRRMAQVIS